MPRRYPPELRRQVIELARSGTRVAPSADTFGMSAVSIYNWLKQDRIDRCEEVGQTTDQRPICRHLFHGASRDRTGDLLQANSQRRRSDVGQTPVSSVITGFASDLRIV